MKNLLTGFYKKTLIALSITALSAGLITVAPANAIATITVCEIGCDYTSIQSAINAASADDTIQVSAGTYAENLTINKSLTILGPNATVAALPISSWEANRGPEAVIGADNTSNRVVISGSVSVTLSGFKFVAPATGIGAQAITSSGGASGTISNNWFSSLSNTSSFSGADIYIQNGNSGSFTISGNYHEGSGMGAAYGFSAINAWNLNSVTIHGNRIEEYGFSGIQLESAKGGSVTSNFIKNVAANGIQAANGVTNQLDIKGNTVDGASLAYAADFGSDPYDRDYCWAGIRLWNSASSSAGVIDVTNNEIKNIPSGCGAIGFTGTAVLVADEIKNNKFDTGDDGVVWLNYAVQTSEVSSNVATLSLWTGSAWASGYTVGSQVQVSGLGAPYDGLQTITAIGTKSITDYFGYPFTFRTLSFAVDSADISLTAQDSVAATAVPKLRADAPVNYTMNYWGGSAGPGVSGNAYNVAGAAVNTFPWIKSYSGGSSAPVGYISNVGFWPSSVVKSELRVCTSGCTYSTIQAAIDAAEAGDTIQVSAGTYAENLTINKSLTILGPNATVAALPISSWEANRGPEAVIGADNTSNRVVISGSVSVTLSGFQFVAPSTGNGAQAIVSSGGASGTISNNWFNSLANTSDFSAADIYIQNGNAGSFTISGNYHEGSGLWEYGVANSGAYGFSAINAWYLDSVNIHGNRIENYGFSGIQLEGTKGGTITSNLIKNVTANGLQAANGVTSQLTIRGNTIDGASLAYADYYDGYPIDRDLCWGGMRLWNSSTSTAGSIDVTNNLIKNIPAGCGGIGLTGTLVAVADEVKNNKFVNVDDAIVWINYSVQKYEVVSNVATLTLWTPSEWGSGYTVGAEIKVSGLGAPFDGMQTISALGTKSVYGYTYLTLSFPVSNANIADAFAAESGLPATVVPKFRADAPLSFTANDWGSSAGPNASGNSNNVAGAAIDTNSWIYSYSEGSAAVGFIDGVGFWSTDTLLSQTVAFTSNAPEGAVVGSTYSVTTLGGESGNPVIVTSLTPTVCVVGVADVVRYLANGTCTLALNQNGNSTFVAATEVTQTFQVQFPGRVPTLSSPVTRIDGFTVRITNFNPAWTYSGVNSAGGVVSIVDGLVTISGLEGNVTSTVTVTSTRSGFVDGVATSAAATTPPPKLALNPIFGDATPNSDGNGFTLPITNYDPFFSWTVTSSIEGAIAIINPVTGVISVTGLDFDVSSNVSVTTMRTGYPNGSASSATVTTWKAPLVPTLGTPVSASDGFTVAITNFDATYNWDVDAAEGVDISVDTESGTVVVQGEMKATTTHFRLTSSKVGYVSATISGSGTSLNEGRITTFGSPVRTFDGFTIQITNYNSDWTYSATNSAGGTTQISNSGLVTVSNLEGGVTSTITVTTTREGYASASATSVEVTTPAARVALIPLFGSAQPTSDGFVIPLSNYDRSYVWSVVPSKGEASIVSSSGLVIVSGLGYGEAATITVTTERSGYPSGSATSQEVTSLLAPRVPQLSATSQTLNGFTFQIENYDADWNWDLAATAKANVTISGSGLVTVTGLNPGKSSTVIVYSHRDGYVSGSADITSAAVYAAFIPTFGKAVRISGGFKIQITNWKTGFTVTGINSLGGSVTISNKGLITVTGLPRNSLSTVTVTTTRSGYDTGVRTTALAKAG